MMNPKKMLTIATVAGLSLGGFGATAALAADGSSPTNQPAVAQISEDGSVELIQDEAEVETDGAEDANGETDENGEREGRRGHRGGRSLSTVAEVIGIDGADLREALQNGDTIADVAEANGVDVDTVIDALVEAKTEKIAEKVESGRITQEQADEKLADLESRITDRINGVDSDRNGDDDNADTSDAA